MFHLSLWLNRWWCGCIYWSCPFWYVYVTLFGSSLFFQEFKLIFSPCVSVSSKWCGLVRDTRGFLFRSPSAQYFRFFSMITKQKNIYINPYSEDILLESRSKIYITFSYPYLLYSLDIAACFVKKSLFLSSLFRSRQVSFPFTFYYQHSG
jgi:hypothetical protein